MFKNDFIVYLRADGKVLRESKENTVLIPFGTEYEIGLHNKSSKRAVVDIEIDGRKVTELGSVVVNANSKVSIERFIKDRDKGRKFKFVEKTAEIEEARGNRSDDGIITVSVQYERPKLDWGVFYDLDYHPGDLIGGGRYHGGPSYDYTRYTFGGSTDEKTGSSIRGVSRPKGDSGKVSARRLTAQNFSGSVNNTSANFSHASLDSSVNETPSENTDGITVKGSKSSQSFTSVNVGALENQTTVFNVCLQGITKLKKKVLRPKTVKVKKVCDVCFMKNPHYAEYCNKCSNALDDI